MGEGFMGIMNEKGNFFVIGKMMHNLKSEIVFNNKNVPKKIELPNGETDFDDFFVGNNHIILLDQLNQVWGLGDNRKGQITILPEYKRNKDEILFFTEFIRIDHELLLEN